MHTLTITVSVMGRPKGRCGEEPQRQRPSHRALISPQGYPGGAMLWYGQGSAYLVWSIMFLPKEVVEEEISRQGILPMVAPVNPYTLLALTCGQRSL